MVTPARTTEKIGDGMVLSRRRHSGGRVSLSLYLEEDPNHKVYLKSDNGRVVLCIFDNRDRALLSSEGISLRTGVPLHLVRHYLCEAERFFNCGSSNLEFVKQGFKPKVYGLVSR